MRGAMVRLLYVGHKRPERGSLIASLRDIAADVEIECTSSVKQALEELSENPFDCVLCEIELGDDMALQFLGAMREREIPVPFILLVSEGQEDIAAEAMHSGADGYFFKGHTKAHSELLFNSIVRRVAAARERVRRLEIEEALRDSEERYRTVVESTSDWICWMGPDRRILYVSPSCESITGYKPRDFFDRPDLMLSIVHPDDREFYLKHIDEEHVKISDAALEFRIIRADGDVRWLSHRCRAVISPDGGFLGRHDSNRDISLQKLAEEELRKSIERSKKQAQMLSQTNRELEAFAFTVSHDLQAPLRRISGWIKLLLTDQSQELSSECRGYLKLVDENSREMRQMIDALLRFSRSMRMELKHESVDLTAIARAISHRFQSEEPDRKAEIIITDGIVADGDHNLLLIVMENLLGNAWKYTSRNKEARIEFSARRDGDDTVYFVKDNGVGFDPTKSEKLFNAFQRLHSEKDFPGMGVGLASVRRIIQRHGGAVWAEGSEGKGATFLFTLSQKTNQDSTSGGVL
jgi:PAS domain S-box-containing protein